MRSSPGRPAASVTLAEDGCAKVKRRKGKPGTGSRASAQTTLRPPVLLEGGVDRGKGRDEAATDRLPDGDADDRDEAGDQAILDGGGAGLVLGEALNKSLHVSSPLRNND